jgi:tol-pal system protein YbgF
MGNEAAVKEWRGGRWLRRAAALATGVACAGALACVTPAELRKVSNRVTDLERGRGASGGGDTGRVADLAAEVEALGRKLEAIQGRLDETEHRVQEALDEARAARSEANTLAAPGAAAGVAPDGEAAEAEAGVVSAEVQQYRDAYAQWRSGSPQACVDQFTKFLQTYPASEYADDATYWLADCYFKQGNFSAAVLRFDDVARQYPSGNKAADALYRQGEALLRMGHGKAAGNAFEKVLRDYPDSARAPEAKKQLDLLGSG